MSLQEEEEEEDGGGGGGAPASPTCWRLDVWISAPTLIEERRRRLLLQMGLDVVEGWAGRAGGGSMVGGAAPVDGEEGGGEGGGEALDGADMEGEDALVAAVPDLGLPKRGRGGRRRRGFLRGLRLGIEDGEEEAGSTGGEGAVVAGYGGGGGGRRRRERAASFRSRKRKMIRMRVKSSIHIIN